MRKLFESLIVFSCIGNACFADFSTPLIDRHFSPYAGAENFLVLHRGLERVEDALFLKHPVPLGMENATLQSGSTVAAELWSTVAPQQASSMQTIWGHRLRNFLFWLPINLSIHVTQHEVFGHGYRLRDLGEDYAKIRGYGIYVIAGVTKFQPTSRITPSQMLTINIAGLEADAILANRIKYKWLRHDQIDPRQMSLQYFSAISLTGYALSVHHTSRVAPTDGNDISGYLFLVNSLYPNGYVSYRSVRNLSFINALDPFVFLFLFQSTDYQSYGKPIPIPMFKIGSVKYLPSPRVVLTPFGIQGFWENYFLKGSSATYAYLKWGKNGPNTYYGLGVENQRIFSWPYATVGARVDLWHQPCVLFHGGVMSTEELWELPEGQAIPRLYPEEVLREKQFGFLASVIGTAGKPDWQAQFFYELGYKTKGYLAGEALRQAPVARIGLSGNF
ncbi:MAG: hypothetical protein HY861_00130 [Chlamydiia bacterium]|nr:hypothetical protein [Chlamydiia bacterium]